jgi:hypothetical protein
MSSLSVRRRSFSKPAITTFRSIRLNSRVCFRLKARSWRTRSLARVPARDTSSMASRRVSPGAKELWSSSEYPRIASSARVRRIAAPTREETSSRASRAQPGITSLT